MNNKTQFKVRFLELKEYPDWTLFLDRCQHSTIYNSVEHVKGLCDSLNISFDIVACFDNNNDIIAGIAFGHSKKFGKKYIYTLPLTPYQSICYLERGTDYQSKKESHHHSIVNKLLSFLESRFSYIKLNFPHSYSDIRPYTWNSYISKVNYTYLVDLQEHYNSDKYDSSLRRQIKKGLKLDFSISDVVNENSIEDYYYLQLKTYKRQGLIFEFSLDSFKNYINNISKQNKGKIYSVNYNGMTISSMIILFDKDTAYYALSATDPEYFTLGLNHILLDHILKQLRDEEIKYFDFVGANTPTVSRYKSGFNFSLVPYYSVEKTTSFSMKTLLQIKHLYVKFRNRNN